MFKDRLLEALKHSKNRSKDDDETARAIAKMGSQKRVSSQEFVKIYDTLLHDDPQVKHQTPNAKS